MALTLTAEQKSVYEIFSGESKYIIPPYQRAYSWNEEQCSEFFEDIKDSFLDKENEGYFIGNIVIAKSNEVKNTSEVIDGQQRLITLTLFIKVLMDLDPNNSALEDSIWLKSRNRNIKEKEQRVKTTVFEDKDSKFLQEALEIKLEESCSKKGDNNFIRNICFFYKEIKEFSKENSIEDFSNYLLDNVSLLPIESTDNEQNKAREKALKIFETINNRGKPLSDSDIFKANLYAMALNKLENQDFIDRWKKLDFECDNIRLKGFDIIRIFKIYSYIIRAEQKIQSSEIGIRNFFMKQQYSPFKNKTHNEIMDELFKILDAIKVYESTIIDTKKNNQLSKWFQLIDIYTNSYPKDLLILFLYKSKKEDSSYLPFLQSLVRYCYYQGSTTKIKFTIYQWMISIIENKKITYYPIYYKLNDYTYFGRLYKGYGLLYTYLQDDIDAIYPYKIKRLRDVTSFKYPNYSDFSKIGHTVMTDIHDKTVEKYDFKSFDKESYNKRIENIKNEFTKFFRNPNAN